MVDKRKNKIYGNCKVYTPDGTLLFLCLEKRANWYLSRNLATVTSTDPLEITLTFTPKKIGNAASVYNLSKKKNACVCCNETDIEILTKHHVFPSEYRKHMPLTIKSRSSHDIVIMCKDCHYEYENEHAIFLKRELEKNCNIERPKLSKDGTKTISAYNIAKLLLDTERCKKIPKTRIRELYQTVQDIFGHTNLEEIVEMKISKEIRKQDHEVGKLVVENHPDHEAFIKLWRNHFIDTMQPKFMPIGWSIDTPIQVEIYSDTSN